MKSEKKLFLVIAIAFLAMALLFGGVLLTVTLLPEPLPDSPGISTEEGENTRGELILLFGPFTRSQPENGDNSNNIKSILIHNGTGEYEFVHPTENDYVTFRIRQNGVTYKDLAPDGETLASLVVATGTPYVRTRVDTSGTAEENYSDYGLAPEDNPAYYEIETYGGESYRVYVGKTTADGTGNFVRVEGRSRIYVTTSTTLGELLSRSAGEFLSPVLLPTAEKDYTYYFLRDVSLVAALRDNGLRPDGSESGRRVTENDRIAVRERYSLQLGEGTPTVKERVTLYDMTDPSLSSAIRQALLSLEVGKSLSLEPVTFVSEVPVTGGGTIRKTEQLTFFTVLYAETEEEILSFDFIKLAANRDFYHGGSLYRITGPSHVVNYTANDTVLMDMLEKIGQLSGTATYKLGLTDEDIGALGLTYRVLSFDYPVSYLSSESTGNGDGYVTGSDVTITSDQYVPVTLYISSPDKDGNCYVGSDYTGLIVQVPYSELAFLEYDRYSFLSDELFSAYINTVSTLAFTFAYTDFAREYLFDLSAAESRTDSYGETVYISLPLNGQSVDYDGFVSLYYYLLYQRYGGLTGLSEEETESLLAGTPVMTMTVTLTDGRVFRYDFYPYTERRSMVAVTGGSMDTGTAFYVSNALPKTIAEAFARYEAGDGFSVTGRYQ